ncbi:uncharacterized protein PHACADRAFT_211919 [Phanerochaete carnosa HHB-10118-sp]|uniref:Uncharacterized protein n=1 Tax=Phanerochaete carnosa (strain HHB-10118-sp) TaxID=650164 RepID=K5W0S4_PHACS|nr:uncharacterized protein PHACADRAFT_211919 [Phanerochaete carnosa HHB-10118-sp]EKM52700.1 hypothetical protein PHACADRAFT_211919 [Phanerochaete carnosa HHB-10118-sp]
MAQNPEYHTFMDYDGLPMDVNLSGIVVPQQVFPRPAGQNDFIPLPPIRFFVNGSLGLNLQSALVPDNVLDNAATAPILSLNNDRAALRILWPGYEGWHLNNALVATVANNPATIANIAYRVASRVQEFYQDMLTNVGAVADWQLQRIPFSALHLVELRNVSQGSWQPVFCYTVPNGV